MPSPLMSALVLGLTCLLKLDSRIDRSMTSILLSALRSPWLRRLEGEVEGAGTGVGVGSGSVEGAVVLVEMAGLLALSLPTLSMALSW